MKRTPFGTMLNNFRLQKKLMVEKVVNAMLEKHKAKTKYGSLSEDFEVRETAVHAQDGSTTIKVELWKRIDVERVKISTSVVAEKVEDNIEVKESDNEW